MNFGKLQEARTFVVPLLRLLHIPRQKRPLRSGGRQLGPIVFEQLIRAARRWANVTMDYQALAMIEQHIQILMLLEDNGIDVEHGKLSEAELKEGAKMLGPSYIKALKELGYSPRTSRAPTAAAKAKAAKLANEHKELKKAHKDALKLVKSLKAELASA